MSVTKLNRTKHGKKVTYYRAQIYVRGVRLADRVFDTQATAHAWHDQEKRKLEEDPSADVRQDITFGEVFELFVEDAKRRLKPSSVQAQESRFPYLRCEILTHTKMEEFNSKTVVLWIRWLLSLPSANSKKRQTYEAELKYLGVVLNWYRNYTDASFVIPITKQHREMVRFKVVQPRRPDYFARPEEIREWIAWLKQHRNPVYHRLATLMVLTGARVGEACGMLWDMIDLDDKTARVVRSVRWDHWTRRPVLQETTKTEGSVRTLNLPDELVDLLRALKGEGNGTGPVFKGANGELLKYNAIQSAFNAGFKALGQPWRSTHICRHTYATIAYLATRDLSAVQASLGHKSYKVTERYAKAVALLNRGTAEKTARVFDLRGRNHTQNHTQENSEEKNPRKISK